jgi:hypothetical protein
VKKRRHGSSFTLVLRDGTEVRGYGEFIGPITARDREAIQAVVDQLRKMVRADSIESVSLTKPP